MTKTQNIPAPLAGLRNLTGDQALILRDEIRTAQTLLLNVIETDLRAQGFDPDTTESLHLRNEEWLELADLEADLNQLLDERYR